jgi:hypothetical protein
MAPCIVSFIIIHNDFWVKNNAVSTRTLLRRHRESEPNFSPKITFLAG